MTARHVRLTGINKPTVDRVPTAVPRNVNHVIRCTQFTGP